MFSLTLIFSFFVSCFGTYVFIQDTPPVQFTINVPRSVKCVARNIQAPITYQWMLIRSGLNYTFPNSNYSDYAIKFSALETGDIVCQAKGRGEVRFTNSTKVHYNVLPSSVPTSVPSRRKVWINERGSFINFKINRPKTLTCETQGFTRPIFYQWINVTTGTAFDVPSQNPRVTLTFLIRIKNGAIRCQAQGLGDAVYTLSAPVSYQVSGQISHKINTFLASVMVVFALTISASQKML